MKKLIIMFALLLVVVSMKAQSNDSVSYTHLDVYKRQ